MSSMLLELSELSDGTLSSPPSSLSEVRPRLSSILGREEALGDLSFKRDSGLCKYVVLFLFSVLDEVIREITVKQFLMITEG